MPTRLYLELLLLVLACFIPPAAIVAFVVVRRRKTAAKAAPLATTRDPRILRAALILGLLIGGYASFYIQFRLAFFTIAASHVMDIPQPYDRWLAWFFWASFAVPVAWVVSVGATVGEFMLKRRLRRIGFCLAAPLAMAVLHFGLWQVFIVSLP